MPLPHLSNPKRAPLKEIGRPPQASSYERLMTNTLRHSLELFSQHGVLQKGCPSSSPRTLTRLVRLLMTAYLASRKGKYILVLRMK